MQESSLNLAVVGAGPVGLALALHAARALPAARVTLFDARPAERDLSGDPRTLALSLGSVQVLQRLGAWRPELAQPILEVHVSQAPPSTFAFLPESVGEPELLIRAIDEAVPMLGAVLDYGAIVAPLQAEWRRAESTEPERLKSRFGARVARLKNTAGGVEVSLAADASTPASGVGIETAEASGGGLGTDDEGRTAHRYDLAVVAEGGVFAGEAPSEAARRPPWRHDYRQTAWVGQVGFAPDAGPARPGMAFERFTRHGPAALLPLRDGRAALVWCVPSDDDPVLELDDTQRVIVLNTLFPPAAGRIASISPLQPFALGLQAERTLTTGRIVRIGNAAQTLHPVAGQGLNLGLRDAFELVRALMQRGGEVDAVLRRLEWQRGPDRWAMIVATDFLARSFTWKLPGAGPARGLGLAALQAIGPAKSAIARQMMFGSR